MDFVKRNSCLSRSTLLLISIRVLLSPLAAFAEEGFHETPAGLPAPVADAWDSVFSLVTTSEAADSARVGTAFVVGHDRSHLYFATASHNLKGCPNRFCKNMALHQASVLQRTSNGRSYSFESLGPITFENIEIHHRSVNPDFGILKVAPDQSFSRNLWPPPLRLMPSIPRTGERVYIIGFPRVPLRTCRTALVMRQADRIIKRWSQGVSMGVKRYEGASDEDTLRYFTSTSDAMNGNSGGPVLNSAGDVVSILVAGEVYPSDGYCYRGSSYGTRH